MVSCRVVAGLAASSLSQLGGASGELLLGALQCGCECRDRDASRGGEGQERREGRKERCPPGCRGRPPPPPPSH